MVDGKFKNLVLNAYKKSFEGNLVGTLYSTASTYEFSDINDIDEFVEKCNSDMLYLKSKLTGNEINVHESELENYKVKESESTIYIKCKNKMEVALMYQAEKFNFQEESYANRRM